MKSAVIMLYHVYVLIDTWWNVNKPCGNLYISCCGCFNRYMVECEFKTWLHNTTGIRVLIDTWWNVNFRKSWEVLTDYMVLIDTWWNVNSSRVCLSLKTIVVLIDTWWNVNLRIWMKEHIEKSFNRYMVECESILTAQQLSEILVLIDTWWNVN